MVEEHAERQLSTYFAELLARPEWMADGLCLEHPEVNFFPERGDTPDQPSSYAWSVRCETSA